MTLFHGDGLALRQSDVAACSAILRAGSRSFYVAARMLPRNIREPAIVLYAFCRLADDIIDQAGRGMSGVNELRGRLARAYEGRPIGGPVDRALSAVLRSRRIPSALPEALLEGFAWDACGRRYRSLAELESYAARVAGSVGAMMCLVMGVRDHATLARACDLGVAMQLTNIARDIGEDARAGRIYLPLEWLDESGIDPDTWLDIPRFDPAIGRLVARLLSRADELYRRADDGIHVLPSRCRAGIMAARLIYAEIGREVFRNRLDSIAARAVVPGQRKLWLGVKSLAALGPSYRRPSGAPIEANAFLVAAVPIESAWRARTAARSGLGDRIGATLDLFARLEARDQAGIGQG
jgi:phytoene synthase